MAITGTVANMIKDNFQEMKNKKAMPPTTIMICLKNSAIVVVRFFGGTLLGTSGLIQAYGNAAKLSLKKAEIIKEFVVSTYRVTFGYDILNEIHRILKENEVKISQKETHDLNCIYEIEIKNLVIEKLKKQITQLRSHPIKLEEL